MARLLMAKPVPAYADDVRRRQGALNDLWSLVNAELGGVVAEHAWPCRMISKACKMAPTRVSKKQWHAYVEWLRDGVEIGADDNLRYKVARYWSLTQVAR